MIPLRKREPAGRSDGATGLVTVNPGDRREPQQDDLGSTLPGAARVLEPFHLGMVRVALALGFVSAAVVAAGTVLPHLHHGRMFHGPILFLAFAAAVGNGVLALLPWQRWVGTARAARLLTAWATAVVVVETSAGPPPPVFRADHPFFLVIRDKQSGAILFLGRIASPEPAS